MPTSPLARLASDRLGVPVEDFIADLRQQGVAYRRIAGEILRATDGQIDVTDVTIRNWDVTAAVQATAR